MKESAKKYLEKAVRAVESAERLLASNDLESAASRAYYAMFYIAEAMLEEKGLRFKKHGGVHAAFGEHFVKGGIIDQKYHRWILDAFNKRITADYGVEMLLLPEDIVPMIEQIREFLKEARRIIGS